MRLFVGIEIPDALRRSLGETMLRLEGLGLEARFPRSAGLHVTLKFLGETAPDQVEEIRSALAAVAARRSAFEIVVEGMGTFPERGRPRVVWAGVRDGSALYELQEDVEASLARLGFPRESRPFEPHLTLARLKSARATDELRRFLEREGATCKWGTFPVDEFQLIESRLHPEGAVYRKVVSFPLEGSA